MSSCREIKEKRGGVFTISASWGTRKQEKSRVELAFVTQAWRGPATRRSEHGAQRLARAQ